MGFFNTLIDLSKEGQKRFVRMVAMLYILVLSINVTLCLAGSGGYRFTADEIKDEGIIEILSSWKVVAIIWLYLAVYVFCRMSFKVLTRLMGIILYFIVSHILSKRDKYWTKKILMEFHVMDFQGEPAKNYTTFVEFIEHLDKEFDSVIASGNLAGALLTTTVVAFYCSEIQEVMKFSSIIIAVVWLAWSYMLLNHSFVKAIELLMPELKRVMLYDEVMAAVGRNNQEYDVEET